MLCIPGQNIYYFIYEYIIIIELFLLFALAALGCYLSLLTLIVTSFRNFFVFELQSNGLTSFIGI